MDESNFGMTTRRVESLSDNVFSVAMTLLVFNLTIPEVLRLSDTELHVLLMNQWRKFLNYFISFLLLSVLWSIHHQQFRYIMKTNRVHLWINIFILMFVVLVPFSTSLIGDYSGTVTANVFFSANMVVLAALFHVNWVYAIKDYRLVHHDLAMGSLRKGTKRSILFLTVSLLALSLSFFAAQWSPMCFVLIPVVFSLKTFRTSGDVPDHPGGD
ncbi:MAG: DUF1211 domain-containing protein [Syntrophaceae bacterium]|nr:DUF1211 domain-containing protein [Syntrophaceae bacterium]